MKKNWKLNIILFGSMLLSICCAGIVFAVQDRPTETRNTNPVTLDSYPGTEHELERLISMLPDGERRLTTEQFQLSDEEKIQLYREGNTVAEIDYAARLAVVKQAKNANEVGILLKDYKAKAEEVNNHRIQAEQEGLTDEKEEME